MAADKTDAVRTAYLEDRSIAALARGRDVGRDAVRTAVADLMPDHITIEGDVPGPELPVTLDMPGKVADFLRAADREPAERAARPGGDRAARPGLHPARQCRARRAPRAPRPLFPGTAPAPGDRCHPLVRGGRGPARPGGLSHRCARVSWTVVACTARIRRLDLRDVPPSVKRSRGRGVVAAGGGCPLFAGGTGRRVVLLLAAVRAWIAGPGGVWGEGRIG
ncbi:hypothetical protein GCM10010277_80220 [Streptomyces longisporoflavus]|nr:hypothetical protein GCM10010277_80220 [Streptomyces longisporoflavus]